MEGRSLDRLEGLEREAQPAATSVLSKVVDGGHAVLAVGYGSHRHSPFALVRPRG